MRFIKLGNAVPVASGSTRDVYVHPDDDGLLIKVVPPAVIEKRYGSDRPWYKTPRRYRHFMTYLREVREQIALRAQGGAHPASVQRIVGFAETDLGLGLVVEAAKDRQGQLAPTLERLIAERRFDAAARADLMACLDELMALPIVIADLHFGNLVYAWSEERGHHFVVIDGIGCKNLIPLNRLSIRVNRYSKHQRVQYLVSKIDKALARAAADDRSRPSAERPLVAG